MPKLARPPPPSRFQAPAGLARPLHVACIVRRFTRVSVVTHLSVFIETVEVIFVLCSGTEGQLVKDSWGRAGLESDVRRFAGCNHSTGWDPAVAGLMAPGSGTEWSMASGPGALGSGTEWSMASGLGAPVAPAVPRSGHACSVALGPRQRAGTLWEAGAYGPREPQDATQGRSPRAVKGAPSRAMWAPAGQAQRYEAGRARGYVRGTGHGGVTETPVSVGGLHGRPGRQGLGASRRQPDRRLSDSGPRRHPALATSWAADHVRTPASHPGFSLTAPSF